MKKADPVVPDVKAPPVRGKYANLLERGSNIAILDPDVVEHFPDSESVNHALRAFLAFGKEFELLVAPQRRPPKRAAGARQKLVFDPRTGRRNSKTTAAK